MIVSGARDLAQSLLADAMPRRWAHTQRVASNAHELAPLLGDDADLVEAAAWVHDIGYAPTVTRSRAADSLAPEPATGFHPLDGARHLRNRRFGDRPLWTLVAHHTGAVVEAAARGLDGALTGEFPAAAVPAHLLDAVSYADLTASPTGQRVTPRQRLDEILSRYPADHVVHQAIATATPDLLLACERVTARRWEPAGATPSQGLPSAATFVTWSGTC